MTRVVPSRSCVQTTSSARLRLLASTAPKHADRRLRAPAFTSADFGQAEALCVVLSVVTVLVPGLRGRPELERAPVAGAQLAAVPEALETREEDLSAVTKLLDKPGDLQNGALVTSSLPEGHVMIVTGSARTPPTSRGIRDPGLLPTLGGRRRTS